MADAPMLKNLVFGFQVLIPASMRVDTLVQKVFDGPKSIPVSHAWAFIQAQIPSKADPHWQRILVHASQGMGIDEAQWSFFTASRFRGTRAMAPKGSVVDSVVRWTPDTVEMRLGIEDPVTGEFVNERCIGTKAGRPRSAVVCVQTAAETAEALAAVRESLVLTSRDWR